ncbi:MAG: cysteine synthase A [Christensenellaceae bacterium]|nr:cysteine synthase A [Christensenellaceae bacterium]
MLYHDLTELIGNTPLVSLSHIAEGFSIAAKLEYFNPLGSVKDRAAMGMISDAEEKGLLKKGSLIIEPTSGNTGVGLAFIAAIRGYQLILTMPENMSLERRQLLSALGAKIVLTEASGGMAASIKKAEELLLENPGAFMPMQFENPANAEAHKTTAEEIWRDTEGKIDAFVAAVGTGGTLSGTGKYLRMKNEKIEIIAVEPDESAVLSGEKAGSHGIQGIGAGFIPKILDTSLISEVIRIKTEDAKKMTARLAKEEGILCGISSGAAVLAAISYAEKPENKGKNIVVLLPDTGERYLSAGVFS